MLNRAMILSFAIIFFIYIIGVLSWEFLRDPTHAKDFAGAVQSWVTVAAIAIAGVFAVLRLEGFRNFAPHLTISHYITHRVVGTQYVHIAVTATLHNSSKVKIEISEGFFRLQQISPISDEEIEELEAQVFVDKTKQHIQWPTLVQLPRHWEKNELIIEPGESHQETCEFIISRKVNTALIYTYYYNQNRLGSSEGWGVTSVYDMIISK